MGNPSRFTLAAFVVALVAPAAAGAADLVGAITVIDGDTIEVAGVSVDLFGIDAPELDQVCRLRGKEMPCGAIARTALMDLTAAASAECTRSSGGAQGAGVALCRVEGFDLSRNMVHTGWALADRAVSGAYAAIEDKARAARRGLWRTEFVAPWRWRAGERLPAPAPAGATE